MKLAPRRITKMGMKLPSSFQTHNNSWTRERKLVTDRQTDRLNVCLVCVTKRKSIAMGLSLLQVFIFQLLLSLEKKSLEGFEKKTFKK